MMLLFLFLSRESPNLRWFPFASSISLHVCTNLPLANF